jgi:hypothetical protein
MTVDISVLMTSGEIDEWKEVADAIDLEGSLVIVDTIEDEEVPDDLKTIEVRKEIPNEPFTMSGGTEQRLVTPEPTIKVQTFQVLAQYAAGMWMKVEFE